MSSVINVVLKDAEYIQKIQSAVGELRNVVLKLDDPYDFSVDSIAENPPDIVVLDYGSMLLDKFMSIDAKPLIILVTDNITKDHLNSVMPQGVMDIIGLDAGMMEIATRLRSGLRLKAEMNEHVSREKELRDTIEKLEKGANIDPITGAVSTALYENIIQTEWMRAKRGQDSLSILVIEPDNFAAYEQSMGEVAANMCLRQLATSFRSMLKRPGDFLARLEKYRFIAALPCTEAVGALRLANRMVLTVRELDISHPKTDNGLLTVSIGVAGFMPEMESQYETLLQSAENMLREAVILGGDQVRLDLTSVTRGFLGKM